MQLNTIKAYQQNLDLTNSRFQGGISTELDVEQAKATLANAQAQLAGFKQNRDEFEHAIAVADGVPPASFSIPFGPLEITPPRSRRGCPPTCSSAGPMWPRRSGESPRRTPRSAWPSPPTSPSCG